MLPYVLTYIVPAAYALLPAAMQTPAATALLLAIGLQESRFTERRQLGGPARSFFMFEEAGVKGVLEHPRSAGVIAHVLEQLQYPRIFSPAGVTLRHLAIEHNDILALCFARCLLWTLPSALPGPFDVERGWDQYVAAWNPGAARDATRQLAARERWTPNYLQAWTLVRQHDLHTGDTSS